MSGPNCLIVNDKIRELTRKIYGETESSVKTAVELWQQKNNKSIDEYPEAKELSIFIHDMRSEEKISSSSSTTEEKKSTLVVEYNNNWTREDVANDSTSLYIFTDNTDRDSGSGKINPNSKYAAKYGKNKHYPSRTQAVIRGLDNAMPISTQRWYHEGAKGASGRWTDDAFEEFKSVINAEIQAIKEEWDTGKYIRIVVGSFDGFFNTSISAITRERTPLIYEYLENKLKELYSYIDPSLNVDKTVIQENKQVKTNLLESFTPVKGVTSLEEQRQVDLTFDPMTRRDRVTAITRLFSLQVTMALEEMKQNLESRIENSNDPDEINSLMEELESLDRKSVISKLKPGGIFRRVLRTYKEYLEDSLEGRIESELNTINQREQEYKELYPDFEGFSIEEKRASAERKAKYKSIEYQKIVDNFKALAEEACPELEFTEDLKVTLDSIGINKANIEEEINEDQDLEQEVAYKDGWMTNFRFVSAQNSLSAAVRKVINTIPKLDYEGKYDEDDLGNQKYLDPQYVHATLIDKLRYMTSSKDMMPLLKKLAQTKPWVEQIIELLEEDDILKSQFYRDFRKDFVNYWIIKKKLISGGSYIYETIPINKPEGIYYLLEEWRDNHDSGVILDIDSVYRKDGTINISKAEKGLEYVKSLQVKMQNLSSNEEKLEELAKSEVFNTVVKLLHMLGINANVDILEAALYNDKSTDKIKYTAPITLLLGNLDVIYSKIVAGEMNPVTREDGTEERKDLINTFGGAYNAIALMLAEVTEDAIESNVRENDKNYYSHVTPSYLGKLIKKLKNVIGDEEAFQEYIEKEFKQYSWFYKDGYWRNDWLRELITNPNKRQLLDHKVVLNMDKVAYTDWDSLDYTIAMLTEYWSDPNGKSAWYHVPILSDAPSAEFIKFNRYTTGSVLDEQGNKMSYENIILDKMADIVSQEYDRIILVRQRDAEYQKGNPKITQIANYDIKRDKEGEIVSLGGAEFKFFPYLNTLKLDNGKTFLEELESRIKASNDKDASAFKSFIVEELRKMMDSQFEATFKKWEKIGLLDKVSKESKVFKYLPQKSDKTVKEALREYFYNSKLATSQIIQLTTTDLAFYKDIEDFQKRFKEIHAPSLRLNTEAVFNGIKVGREWERTIYIADDEIASSIADDVYSIIYGKYKNGEMSAYDAAYIISKFGYSNHEVGNKKYVKIDNAIVETSYVNVADAQAYRSLSSYRAVMIMSGEWSTEEHEVAYQNLQSGKWTASDFRTIWQTQKPFVYTQINNESGIENKNGDIEGIKTPVQHKNSEFLLLAMHELISGPLGKSSKLRAINKFMEDHQLDVVQFESTTKVGKQGVIDLSDVNSEADVIKRLELATGINAGGENPNVVHKIPYEDYGKQTATPEHIIDVEQLVGTQIRKLITADISNDAIIEVNGKKLTKKEWLDLYQAIITENIIQSFVEVDKIFKDPKKVEEILQDFLRDNRRYGDDIRRACVYNEEKGSFNIPFYDPVISQTIQQILNSIIKNRITKQKIRGGACIQVSDYGLTEELSIVFKDSKGNLLNWESYKKKYKNATRQEYEDFVKKAREEGSLAIAYFECYMPAYSKEFYEPLMKPGTQELDIEKLPEDLRRAVGYRVPTEDKYSMVPIRIKGFLPQQNGSAIMLPAEITTLSGSDFDKHQCRSKIVLIAGNSDHITVKTISSQGLF